MRLKDKVTIVTGAGAGIGRATALLAAREGANVVVAELLEDRGRGVTDEITGAGGRALFVPTDVGEPAQIEALYDTTLKEYGRVDVVVNNAYGSPEVLRGDGDIADVEDAVWERVLDTALRSVFLSCRRAVREMQRTGGGSIVNLSSVNGLQAYGLIAYSTAKGGIIALTRSASVTYARDGIRMNAICPGTVETASTGAAMAANPGMREHLDAMYPRGAIGQPEEIATTVVFLASDEASFINGAVLVVDGGLTVGPSRFDLAQRVADGDA